MATPAHRLIQDQNSSFLYTGSNPGVKTDATTRADKKRAFGARKALNDISNSRKPSVFQATTKEASKKGLASEKGITVISKSKVPKASEKENTCGRRKALTDLTNSAKPSLDRVSKVAGKLNVIAEEKEKIPSLADERFIHNHQECIKAQRKAVDADYFLEAVGLKNGYCRQLLSLSARKRGLCDSESSSDNPERHERIVQIEEIPEMLLFDDRQSQTPLSEFSRPSSPICCSPKSPYLNSEDDVDLSDLLVIDFD